MTDEDKWVSANIAVLKIANKLGDLFEAQDTIGQNLLSDHIKMRARHVWLQTGLSPRWADEPFDKQPKRHAFLRPTDLPDSISGRAWAEPNEAWDWPYDYICAKASETGRELRMLKEVEFSLQT
jgi:hypothetical protein